MGELETLPVLSAGRLMGRVSKFQKACKLQIFQPAPWTPTARKKLGGRVMGAPRYIADPTSKHP